MHNDHDDNGEFTSTGGDVWCDRGAQSRVVLVHEEVFALSVLGWALLGSPLLRSCAEGIDAAKTLG